MSHHEHELGFAESVAFVDPHLAGSVTRWNEELPRDTYKERIHELLEHLEDGSRLIGREGDEAAHLLRLTKEHYDSLRD